MALYESTFIIRQDLSAQDANSVIEEISNMIKEKGGKLLKKEYWGLRNLAYKIEKRSKGHYILLGIDAPAEVIKEIERRSKISETIVRNLTINVEYISKDPSPVMEKNDEAA